MIESDLIFLNIVALKMKENMLLFFFFFFKCSVFDSLIITLDVRVPRAKESDTKGNQQIRKERVIIRSSGSTP